MKFLITNFRISHGFEDEFVGIFITELVAPVFEKFNRLSLLLLPPPPPSLNSDEFIFFALLISSQLLGLCLLTDNADIPQPLKISIFYSKIDNLFY